MKYTRNFALLFVYTLSWIEPNIKYMGVECSVDVHKIDRRRSYNSFHHVWQEMFGRSLRVVGESFESSLKTILYLILLLLSLSVPFPLPLFNQCDSHRHQYQIGFGASHFLICLKAAKSNKKNRNNADASLFELWQQQQSSKIKLLNSCFSH